MATKKVLGRGLGAFFPEYASDEEKAAAKEETAKNPVAKSLSTQERINVVLHVPVDHIRPNPHQPRSEFSEEALDELAASIREHGLIQPITVRYLGEKRFELISGERRLRASKLAGIDEIPAYIREADDEQSMAFALIENIQREELNPLEVAVGYKRLLNEFNLTQAEVAQRVGKNRSTVTNMMRLLALPDFVQLALKNNDITAGHARALLPVEDEKHQKQLLSKIIKQDWSVRQIEEAIRKLSATISKKKTVALGESNPFIEEISNRLRRTLGTKVNLRPKKDGGEIRIEYYSDEDLERILSKLDSIS
jgi:ParB family chromosome partitioning protein